MIAARYASLIAFAQSRGGDCGRTPDGKFASGNNCAVEVADVPKIVGVPGSAIAGAAIGAAIGSVAGVPGMAAGGVLGAAFGAVHALLSKSMPEMVADAQRTVGLTARQVDALARVVGGSSKEKAVGFVTTLSAFGIWAPNDDIALVTASNPFDRGAGDPSRHLHFEPTPETMRSGKAARIAVKAAKAAGADTVTVSSRGPISAKSLTEDGFRVIDHKSELMKWSGTVLFQKEVKGGASRRAFCPNGEGNGVTNNCSSKDGGSGQGQMFSEDTSQWNPAETLPKDFPREYWTEKDKQESYAIVDTAAGKVPVLDRRDTSTPDYLDEIECHGEECGMAVEFDGAKELQGDNSKSPYASQISPDWSPLDAYIGKGFGYFTGNAYDGGESIDFHGVEYGTIDDSAAADLAREKQEKAREEWESLDKVSEYGEWWNSASDEEKEDSKKNWLADADDEIYREVDDIRGEARTKAVEQMKHDLESAIAYEKLECCLQLYRGVRVDSVEAEKILREGFVTHDAVNSWTTSRGTARSFGGNKLLLVVRRPRVGYVFAPNTHDEAEVVRPPAKMKITGAVKTKTGMVLYVDEDEDYIRMHGAHA